MSERPLRGVNLGGWLVLEKWITPSLFKGTEAVDEYTYCQHAGASERTRLKKHRDSFITKADFQWLAEQDIDAVRLPIGYWVFGEEQPFEKTIEYVDKAFRWAEETDIKILLDLHGVRGSQNGRDHSGRQGTIEWHQNQLNIAHSLEVLRKLAERYRESPALLGLSLLNEPFPTIPKATLMNFYEQAYRLIRRICAKTTWIVFSDGYLPTRWRKELPLDKFPDMYIDTHHYQTFTPLDKLLPPRLNLWRARCQLPWKLKRLNRYHPVVVGEWSLTLDDSRLKKLNSKERGKIAAVYAQEQLKAFNKTAAWFFWTYRTESGGTWSFHDCTEKGLLL